MCYILDDLVHDVEFVYEVIEKIIQFVNSFLIANLYVFNFTDLFYTGKKKITLLTYVTTLRNLESGVMINHHVMVLNK